MAAELGVVPAAEFTVGARRGQLHRPEGVDQPAMDGPPGEGKILDSPQRVDAPQSASAGTLRLPSRSVSWRAVMAGLL